MKLAAFERMQDSIDPESELARKLFCSNVLKPLTKLPIYFFSLPGSLLHILPLTTFSSFNLTYKRQYGHR